MDLHIILCRNSLSNFALGLKVFFISRYSRSMHRTFTVFFPANRLKATTGFVSPIRGIAQKDSNSQLGRTRLLISAFIAVDCEKTAFSIIRKIMRFIEMTFINNG